MKNSLRNIALAISLALTGAAHVAATPAMDVSVAHGSGKVAFTGKTSANGTFATGKLEPGNYVVQFTSKNAAVKGNQYRLVISAGKKKVSADSISGDKFAAGGVAMKLDGVGAGMNITGQVANAAAAGSDPNVKIIKGKRYVWVKGGETGSNLGGRWVEEGSLEAQNVTRVSKDSVNRRQEHADAHQEGFGGR